MDMIRISTETLDDLHSRLTRVTLDLDSCMQSVRSVMGKIDRQSGANVQVPVSIGNRSYGVCISGGTAKEVLNNCTRAIGVCKESSHRLSAAVKNSSALFLDNEDSLIALFENTDEGSTSTNQGSGSSSGGGAGSEMEKNDFVSGMMDFLQKLLSMGDDGQKIFAAIMAAIRALGGSALSAQAIALSNMSLAEIISSSAGEALFGKMSGLAVASFLMKVATGVASDIESGLPADRIICNALGNTITGALTTIGGAVVGDVAATALMGALAAVPGLQPALPAISFVVYPLCNVIATMGIDAAMSMEVFGKPVSQHLNDAIYAAYNGITEGVQVAQEVFSTLSDYAQTGAEMIQQGVESVVDFAGDVVDSGVEFVNNVVDNSVEFVNDVVDSGVEFVNDVVDSGQEFISNVADGFTGLVNTGLSWLGA